MTDSDRPESAVTLGLPPDANFVRVARAAAVACASLASFDVDDLVDVRLLVDEVFHALATLGKGMITMTLHTGERRFGVTMRAAAGTGHWNDAEYELVRRVIDVITVTAAIGDADGDIWFEAQLQAMSK